MKQATKSILLALALTTCAALAIGCASSGTDQGELNKVNAEIKKSGDSSGEIDKSQQPGDNSQTMGPPGVKKNTSTGGN